MTLRDVDVSRLSRADLRRRIALLREALPKAGREAARAQRAASVAVGRYHTIMQLLARVEREADMRRLDKPRSANNKTQLTIAEQTRHAQRYRELVLSGQDGSAAEYARSIGYSPRSLRRWVARYV